MARIRLNNLTSTIEVHPPHCAMFSVGYSLHFTSTELARSQHDTSTKRRVRFQASGIRRANAGLSSSKGSLVVFVFSLWIRSP